MTHPIDPVKLKDEVLASYSADKIAYGDSLRSLFKFNGENFVCTGYLHKNGAISCHAYRVVPLECYAGETCSHNRNPNGFGKGFYEGMVTKFKGRDMVLTGPEETFVEGEKEQGELF